MRLPRSPRRRRTGGLAVSDADLCDSRAVAIESAGPPSARVVVPLVGAVAPPSAVAAQMPTEKAVVIDWTPPVAEAGMPPLGFNVYRREDTGAALNPAPLAEPEFEIGNVEYGKEQCFVVRTVQTLQNVTLESAPSAPACLTPLDTFPPAAPKGLRTVAEDGAVSLSGMQNTEADLDGYLVLRGDAPGDTLLPLTPQPIKDASYRDATVKPGYDTSTPWSPWTRPRRGTRVAAVELE